MAISKDFNIIDVREFGAVGNGSTDDSSAIQSAINNMSNGSRLIIPSGHTFRITSPITITGKEDFTLEIHGIIYADNCDALVLDDCWNANIYASVLRANSRSTAWANQRKGLYIKNSGGLRVTFDNIYYFWAGVALTGEGGDSENISFNLGTIYNTHYGVYVNDASSGMWVANIQWTGGSIFLDSSVYQSPEAQNSYAIYFSSPVAYGYHNHKFTDISIYNVVNGINLPGATDIVFVTPNIGYVVNNWITGDANTEDVMWIGGTPFDPDKCNNIETLIVVGKSDYGPSIVVDAWDGLGFIESLEYKASIRYHTGNRRFHLIDDTGGESVIGNGAMLTTAGNGWMFGALRVNGGTNRIEWRSSIPVSGTYAVGDLVFKTEPVEEGTTGQKYIVFGWVCVEAGAPGTWLPLRALTGN